jgi:hypothetical protein
VIFTADSFHILYDSLFIHSANHHHRWYTGSVV